jgi:fatty-acyl-CoA synthase
MLLVESRALREELAASAYATHDFESIFATDKSPSPDADARHHGRGVDPIAWLVTSGTTGNSRAIRISNHRAVLSGFGIAHFCLELKPSDVIYCALPLSHATALMTGLCAALVAGCTLVIRRQFATTGFWCDVKKERATCLLYVGEVARYLLAAPPQSGERTHRLRLAYGNGLALDVWHRFQARFRIPRIVEFYGATELPLAMVNLGGRPGSIGRTTISLFSPWRIVRRDPDTGKLARRADGTYNRSDTNEPGEMVLLTHPLRKNDPGLRTGDIVVRDANGYVQFMDRSFDVFRQKGYNVSTFYVARQLRQVDGVAAVGLTHLRMPHYDGQLGLAVIAVAENFSVTALEQRYSRLADHERPRFLRITGQLRLNCGLKFDQAAYRAEGLDPGRVSDPTYVYASGHFRPITNDVWRELCLGLFRF